jgi:hypothetical protein
LPLFLRLPHLLLQDGEADSYFHSSSLECGGPDQHAHAHQQRGDSPLSRSASSSASLSSPGLSSCAHTSQQDLLHHHHHHHHHHEQLASPSRPDSQQQHQHEHQHQRQQQQQDGEGAGLDLTLGPSTRSSAGGAGAGPAAAAAAAAAAAPAAAAGGAPTGDAAWDSGPAGITFAEPVTTPTKDARRSSSAELKPSLSRVESLSNSFIDDLESCDGHHGGAEGTSGV